EGKPKVLWQVDGITARFATPVVHDGRVYIPDVNAQLYCLDAKDGKRQWKMSYGRNSMGSPVWADGKIYLNPVQDTFVILKPEDKKADILHEQFFSPAKDTDVGAELNGTPAVANGRVYFQTSNECYCIGKKDHKAKADPIPEQPKEAEGGKAASLAVYPADVVLTPGESKEFTVRVLDA